MGTSMMMTESSLAYVHFGPKDDRAERQIEVSALLQVKDLWNQFLCSSLPLFFDNYPLSVF